MSATCSVPERSKSRARILQRCRAQYEQALGKRGHLSLLWHVGSLCDDNMRPTRSRGDQRASYLSATCYDVRTVTRLTMFVVISEIKSSHETADDGEARKEQEPGSLSAVGTRRPTESHREDVKRQQRKHIVAVPLHNRRCRLHRVASRSPSRFVRQSVKRL